MSAISLIFNRDASPINESAFSDSLSRLHYWGLDGCDSWVEAGIGVGHQHTLITPEEVEASHGEGERQPLIDERYVIAFVGRIDNREDLLRDLGLDRADIITDAALVLRGFREWGDGVFARLLGGFAAAIYDRAAHSVTLARDVLGEVSLYYALDHRRLVVASEPQALFAYPDVPTDLNEQSMLRWFAVKLPLEGETRFTAVRDLPIATILTISADSVRESRYWEPNITQVRYRSDAEYAEHYRVLLDQAVRRCLRCAQPPAVLMSGGYDSTSVAALVARSGIHPLSTISWGFDRLPECDERAYIREIEREYGADATYISGDDANPFEEPDVPFDRNSPEVSPYRILQRRIFRAAVQKGARLALSGWFGNHLFVGGHAWLAEYLQAGEYGKFAAGTQRLIGEKGLFGALRSESMNRARRWAVKRLTGITRFRPLKKPPEWFLPDAAAAYVNPPPTAPEGLRVDQFSATFGFEEAYGGGYMQVYNHQVGLRLASPYRDRQIIEYMVGIPADQLFDGTRNKVIVFRAMQGILPEKIRQRRDFPVQLPMYLDSMRQSAPHIREVIAAPDALWRRYVREDAVFRVLESPQNLHGALLLLPWLCFTLQNWVGQISDSSVK